MTKSTQLIMQCALGSILGSALISPFIWLGSMSQFSPGTKIGIQIVFATVAFWHCMKHRTADKSGIDMRAL